MTTDPVIFGPRASCFLWLQVEGEDGVPRDPVTVTWFPYFKVPLTTGKEQPQLGYLLFNIQCFKKH